MLSSLHTSPHVGRVCSVVGIVLNCVYHTYFWTSPRFLSVYLIMEEQRNRDTYLGISGYSRHSSCMARVV